jgi:hypothetical protein
MGGSFTVGQAVSMAESDMNTVQQAADAISTAIGKVKQWLTPETWRGQEATDWAGNWTTLYNSVQSCLNDLPSAESQIVSAVQTQMAELAQRTRETATA